MILGAFAQDASSLFILCSALVLFAFFCPFHNWIEDEWSYPAQITRGKNCWRSTSNPIRFIGRLFLFNFALQCIGFHLLRDIQIVSPRGDSLSAFEQQPERNINNLLILSGETELIDSVTSIGSLVHNTQRQVATKAIFHQHGRDCADSLDILHRCRNWLVFKSSKILPIAEQLCDGFSMFEERSFVNIFWPRLKDLM